MQSGFSVQITLDSGGVRSVRILGDGWDQSAEAHGLLQRLSPLIARLDLTAKGERQLQSSGGDAVQ